jgi:hypothetical protein
MAITVDAKSLEARYSGKNVVTPEGVKEQDLYYPGSGKPPTQQGQIPQGTPIKEGEFISQVVGRGVPAPQIQMVPPQKTGGPPAPQVAVVPPQQGNRTTLGTIVETHSNPLTGAQPVESPVIPETPPPVEKPWPDPPTPQPPPEDKAPPKKKLDLVLVVLDYIHELGGDKSPEAQKFFDRSEQTLKQWFQVPSRIPLEALAKVLKRNPGVQVELAEQLEPHFATHDNGKGIQSLPNRTKMNCVVCTPILGFPTLPFMWVCLYLAKKYELGFDIQVDTVIHRSRNMLAHRFLQSGATWSLWIDCDIAPPIANAEWFRWITASQTTPDEACRYDVLEKLLGNGKAIVGGVYASRRNMGQLVIQPEIRPRHHEDKLLCNDIRKGTARGLIEVDWVGFGCSLVHREVFLELQRRFPQLAPQAEFAPWRYFQPEGDEGEDEAFCKRAKACGIPIWLDTQLVCGHIGNMAFMPEHTRAIHAL